MIPKNNLLNFSDITFAEKPTNTYRLDFSTNRIIKYTDGIEAVQQAIYKIIYTERYQHEIYNWNYGIELNDLFGRNKAYVYPELKRRITEALLIDDRILAVENFKLEQSRLHGRAVCGADDQPGGNVVFISFTVNTIFGSVDASRELKL